MNTILSRDKLLRICIFFNVVKTTSSKYSPKTKSFGAARGSEKFPEGCDVRVTSQGTILLARRALG